MMKLGKDTGSLVNYLSQQNGFHEPKRGEDVTEFMWTDRHAYRVVEVDPDGKGAYLRPYKPKYVGKQYGDESYEYEDENGHPLLDELVNVHHIRWRHGKWREEGANGKWYPINLAWGMREEYRDPSF